MKSIVIGATLALGVLASAPAFAADYSVISLETTVDRPVDAVWAKVGGYCAIGDWIKRLQPCVLTAGTGDVGSIRKLGPAGAITEILVAKTRYSYTYTQPDTKILYHGTLAAEPIDGGKKTRLLYTLIYDQEPDGTQEAKDKDRAGRTNNFTTALANMKALAEGK
jgi:hypothetical protein